MRIRYPVIEDVTIPEKNFSMPWNARNKRALFAIKNDSVNQAGCIHTVQGLEFDYVGVIIGNDLKKVCVVNRPDLRNM